MEMNGGFLCHQNKTAWRPDFPEDTLAKRILMRLMEPRDDYSLCAVAGGWYLNQVTLD